MEETPLIKQIGFALAVVALGVLAAALMVPVSGIAGFFLYVLLDPRVAADTLASLSFFYLPFLALGVPGLIVAVWCLFRQKKLWLVPILVVVPFLLSTLGFTGFLVGAMGI